MTLDRWYASTERPEERALRRRLRRDELMKSAGAVVLGAAAAVAWWLFAVFTPPFGGLHAACEDSRGFELLSSPGRAMMSSAEGQKGTER